MFVNSLDVTPAQRNMIVRETIRNEERFIRHRLGGFMDSGYSGTLQNDKFILPSNATSRRSTASCSKLRESTGTNLNSLDPLAQPKTKLSSGFEYNPIIPQELPLTWSNEIGRVSTSELASTKRWGRPRSTGPVVRYAEVYYEQNRINPFKHRSK